VAFLSRLGGTIAESCVAVYLAEAEAVAVTVEVVYAVLLMVLVAVTVAVVVAVLVTVAKLVLTPSMRSDVSSVVLKGVVGGNIFAIDHSAGLFVNRCVDGRAS
jgi:hypothetical protein